MQTLPEMKKLFIRDFGDQEERKQKQKTMVIKNVNTFAQSSDLYYCVIVEMGFYRHVFFFR